MKRNGLVTEGLRRERRGRVGEAREQAR